ncbi:DUF2680 domain-containing protein [Petroclostridium sp. X23]|uniref:DUF2680 domain-containing protein n=1 Tax=Petroclostridium sp. X23 TaxID=3045146 RepID=UPI0024ADBE27|nr:DUF2680 domain-containing protein [Petroclostridium sp. X23]WHH60683.1 DUF2680 domain-containing protein [Petroclostridium sp. X23]
MKKKFLAMVLAGGILAAGAAYAAETVFQRPVDVLSDATGQTVEDLYEERSTGKTYGQIADENGVLDQFKDSMLEQKKAIVEQRVEEGTITREQADAFLKAMEERIATCDGTGIGGGLGRQSGMGFGRGSAGGRGQGRGFGGGCGFGGGFGAGFGQQQ